MAALFLSSPLGEDVAAATGEGTVARAALAADPSSALRGTFSRGRRKKKGSVRMAALFLSSPLGEDVAAATGEGKLTVAALASNRPGGNGGVAA